MHGEAGWRAVASSNTSCAPWRRHASRYWLLDHREETLHARARSTVPGCKQRRIESHELVGEAVMWLDRKVVIVADVLSKAYVVFREHVLQHKVRGSFYIVQVCAYRRCPELRYRRQASLTSAFTANNFTSTSHHEYVAYRRAMSRYIYPAESPAVPVSVIIMRSDRYFYEMSWKGSLERSANRP